MGNESSTSSQEPPRWADSEAPPRLVLQLDAVVASMIDQAILDPEAAPAMPPWRQESPIVEFGKAENPVKAEPVEFGKPAHSNKAESLGSGRAARSNKAMHSGIDSGSEEMISTPFAVSWRSGSKAADSSARSSEADGSPRSQRAYGSTASAPSADDVEVLNKLRSRDDGAGLFAQVLLDGEEVSEGLVESFPSTFIELKPQRWDSQVQLKFFRPDAECIVARPQQSTNDDAELKVAVWSSLSASISVLVSFGVPLYASLWVGLHNTQQRDCLPEIDLEDAVNRAFNPDPHVPKVKITLYKPEAKAKKSSAQNADSSQTLPAKLPSSKDLQRSSTKDIDAVAKLWGNRAAARVRRQSEDLATEERDVIIGNELDDDSRPGSSQVQQLLQRQGSLPDSTQSLDGETTPGSMKSPSDNAKSSFSDTTASKWLKKGETTPLPAQGCNIPAPDATSVLKEDLSHTRMFGMYKKENTSLETKPSKEAGLRGLVRCLQQSNRMADDLQRHFTEARDRENTIDKELEVVRGMRDDMEALFSDTVLSRQDLVAKKTALMGQADGVRAQIDNELNKHESRWAELVAGHDEQMQMLCSEMSLAEQTHEARIADMLKDHQTAMQQAQDSAQERAQTIEAQIEAQRGRWKEEHDAEVAKHLAVWKQNHQQACDNKEQALRDERERCVLHVRGLEQQMQTHLQNLRDTDTKKGSLISRAAAVEEEDKTTCSQMQARHKTASTFSQRNFEYLQNKFSLQSEGHSNEARTLKIELERRKQHDQEMLGQAMAHNSFALQNLVEQQVSRAKDHSQEAANELERMMREHKMHIEQSHQHSEIKRQAHSTQAANLQNSIKLEEIHAVQAAEQVSALSAEAESLRKQIVELEQSLGKKDEDHRALATGMASQILSIQQEENRFRIEGDAAVSNLRESHAEQLSSKSLENSNQLSHWDEQCKTLIDDLTLQEQKAEQRRSEAKRTWEQKYTLATESLEGARGRMEQSEAKAAEALDERIKDLTRQLTSAEVRQESEIRALQLQLATLTQSAGQETSRLQHEIALAQEDATKLSERIAADTDLQLEQQRQFHCANKASLAGDHAEQLQQTKKAAEVALAQLRCSHVAWREPLTSELERLRVSRIELQEAKQQGRALEQNIAAETALMEVTASANSDVSKQTLEKRTALASCKTELAVLVSDVEQRQVQIAQSRDEFAKIQEEHRLALTSALTNKEATIAAVQQEVEELRHSIDLQRANANILHGKQLHDLEVKLSEEKHRLLSRAAALENELQEAQHAAEQAKQESMGELKTDVDAVWADAKKTIDELNAQQGMLATIRAQAADATKADNREQETAAAKVWANLDQDVGNRRQAFVVEQSSHLERHETQIKQMQVAHDRENEKFEVSLADSKRKIAAAYARVTRREKELEDAAAEAARLREEFAAASLHGRRGLQDATETQKTVASHSRELSEGRQALIQREAKARQQHLAQQLQSASADVRRLACDLSALQATSEKQRLAASQEAERKRVEISTLVTKLDELEKAKKVGNQELAEWLEHAENQAMLQNKKSGGLQLTAKQEQARLEDERADLKGQLEVAKARFGNVQGDVESQEKLLEEQLRRDLEHQERSFEAQRQSHKTAHDSDTTAQDLELKQASQWRHAESMQERDRNLAEMAQLEASVAELTPWHQRLHDLHGELSLQHERHSEMLQAHKADMDEECRKAERDMTDLKNQHAAKRDEEAARFRSVLAGRKKEGQQQREKLSAEVEEAQRKAVHVRVITQSRQILLDSVLATRTAALKAEASQQMTREQEQIKSTLEADLGQHHSEHQDKLLDVDARQKRATQNFERQVAEQKVQQERELAAQSETERRGAEQTMEKQRILEQRLAAAQASIQSLQGALDEEARSHAAAVDKELGKSAAYLESQQQLRHTQQQFEQKLEVLRAEVQARIQKIKEDRDALVQEAQASALREVSLSSREDVAKNRLACSRSQEEANFWQKRRDAQMKHIEQAKSTERSSKFGGLQDAPFIHPLQHALNRIIFRLYRALVQEKQATMPVEALEGVVNEFPKDAGGYIKLSREDFQDLVRRCADCQQIFSVKQAFCNIDSLSLGEVTENEFTNQRLGLDRDTLSHIFFIMEGASRSRREACNEPAPQVISEESFVNMFAAEQLPCSERLLVRDDEDGLKEQDSRIVLVDLESDGAEQPRAERVHNEEPHFSSSLTPEQYRVSREPRREDPPGDRNSHEQMRSKLAARKAQVEASGVFQDLEIASMPGSSVQSRSIASMPGSSVQNRSIASMPGSSVQSRSLEDVSPKSSLLRAGAWDERPMSSSSLNRGFLDKLERPEVVDSGRRDTDRQRSFLSARDAQEVTPRNSLLLNSSLLEGVRQSSSLLSRSLRDAERPGSSILSSTSALNSSPVEIRSTHASGIIPSKTTDFSSLRAEEKSSSPGLNLLLNRRSSRERRY